MFLITPLAAEHPKQVFLRETIPDTIRDPTRETTDNQNPIRATTHWPRETIRGPLRETTRETTDHPNRIRATTHRP